MKLVLLGGGVRMPAFVDALVAGTTRFGEIAIVEPDRERRETFGRLAVERARRADGGPVPVRVTADPEEAFEGAAVVFAAIRVGGDRSRVIDEEVAVRHGLVGQETTGPGGAAMALRTIPVLAAYAEMLERQAPQALFVNLTNPVGITTQALVRTATSLRVVGVCDTPSSTIGAALRFLGADDRTSLSSYGGLNHLGWISSIVVDGQERLGELLERFEELRHAERCFVPFDPAFVRRLGCLPTEYLFYFYDQQRYVETVRNAGRTRGVDVEAMNLQLLDRLHRGFSAGGGELAWTEYLDALSLRRSSYLSLDLGESTGEPAETAAEQGQKDGSLWLGEGYEGVAMRVVEGALGPCQQTAIVNTRNGTALGFLEPDDVVEVPALLSLGGTSPLVGAELPPAARSLVMQVKDYERGIVDASLRGDAESAAIALSANPLVPGLSAARSLVSEYRQRHGTHLAYLR